MGRPPIPNAKITSVRLPDETRARIIALVGQQRMAGFIREAVEAALDRHDRAERRKASKAEA